MPNLAWGLGNFCPEELPRLPFPSSRSLALPPSIFSWAPKTHLYASDKNPPAAFDLRPSLPSTTHPQPAVKMIIYKVRLLN